MEYNEVWKNYKIEELGKVIGGGTPSTKNSEYFNGEIPWITPKDLSNFRGTYISRGERNITDKGLKYSSARLLPKDTVLLSSRAPIGYLAIASNKVTTNQGFKSIVCNKELILPFFLFYRLKNDMKKIKSSATGSTFSELSGKAVKQIELKIPPLRIQKKISEILKNIDSKIEINLGIIANLEELSQILFKRWFVDFEFPNKEGNPYKSSKGEFISSSQGLIPKTSSIGTIDQIGSIIGGGTPSKKIAEYYTASGISWITPKDLSIDKSIFIYNGQIDITNLGLEKSSAKLMPKESILFSSRAPIGYIAITGKPVATNQGFKSIVPNKGLGPYYIYFLLKQMLPVIKQSAGGSTFKEISGKGLKNIEIIIPNKNIVDKFNEIVKVYFDKIKSLELEVQLIENLRDTLLPKLMSGELELPDDLEVEDHAEFLQ